MKDLATNTDVLGHSAKISFPEQGLTDISARIDTGARTSAIWASRAELVGGRLEVVFLGSSHDAYSGQVHTFDDFSSIVVTSSNGQAEERFMVKLLVRVVGRKIRASFTLANRSQQVYPVLVGRNILRGKFIVDVKQSMPLTGKGKL